MSGPSPPSTSLTEAVIERGPTNRRLVGRKYIRLAEIDSTNSWLLRNPDLLKERGLVVLADRQTGGRGRHNRTWEGGAQGHLFCSFLLHPSLPPDRFPSLTLLAGLAVHRTLTGLGIDRVQVKWPNDVLAAGRKVCGILCETGAAPGDPVVVIGIGVNLQGDEGQFPMHLQGRVTTIERVLGRAPGREDLLETILDEADGIFSEAEDAKGIPPGLLQEWERYSGSLGRAVAFEHGGRRAAGRIVGLNPMGQIVIEGAQGARITLVSGEVTFLDPPSHG